MSDFLEGLADEAADVSSAPSDSDVTRLRETGEKLVRADSDVRRLEAELDDAKRHRHQLAHKTLPDIMNELGTDSLGLAEANADLVLSAYYHANISKDWEDQKRAAGFAHIEELGGGDIVRAIMTVSAGKGDLETLRLFFDFSQTVTQASFSDDQQERIRAATDWLLEHGQKMGQFSASWDLELAVAWNTLTSFVREQTERGAKMNLDALGATVGEVVKIKPRKD